MVGKAPTPPQTLPEHAPELARILRGLGPLAVALSGGLDSRFLCHAAQACGCDVLAVHASGPHIPPEESREAAQWAQARGLSLLTLEFNPLALPLVAHNSPQRCYGCKQGLIALLRAELARAQRKGGPLRSLCDGSNADDLTAHRPGLQALAEGGVRSPLAEAGLSKAELRALAQATGLDRPQQRARPCLLTRLAYGLTPRAEDLQRLAAAESALAALIEGPETAAAGHSGDAANVAAVEPEAACALGDFRLRLTPEPLLQVTRLPSTLRPAVEAILARHGFAPCRLVLSASVSGFFDAQSQP